MYSLGSLAFSSIGVSAVVRHTSALLFARAHVIDLDISVELFRISPSLLSADIVHRWEIPDIWDGAHRLVLECYSL